MKVSAVMHPQDDDRLELLTLENRKVVVIWLDNNCSLHLTSVTFTERLLDIIKAALTQLKEMED